MPAHDALQPPLVMVSGCFDQLHCGHLAFLEAAARYGRLIVSVGSDATITRLKGQPPVFGEQERLSLVAALKCVEEAVIGSGTGYLDFEPELRRLRPAVFVVNHDGDHPAKRPLCEELGTEYVVLDRQPPEGLPERSSSQLRELDQMPYRIDLAGGWLDQPFVSKLHPGPVIVASLEPTHEFQLRSGMATSTRQTAQRLWGNRLPCGEPVELARMLFACENPPGRETISGSQDALGIVLPGVHRLDYAGEYWPRQITSLDDAQAIEWLQEHLYLIHLGARPAEFDVLVEAEPTMQHAARLAAAAKECWIALQQRDLQRLGVAMTDTYTAQRTMFPRMEALAVRQAIEALSESVLGYKLAGAGGGGYLVVVVAAEKPIDHALKVAIRHEQL